MKPTLKKLLYYIGCNSRISGKELGKKLRMSQQAASYHIKSLEDKKLIKAYTTIIDPIKLGYIHVLIGFRLKELRSDKLKKMQSELLNIPEIVNLQVGAAGVDFLVEFSAQNLSSFNKTYDAFMGKNYKEIKTLFIYPIIVRHKYPRNYLATKSIIDENVILGDRDLATLNSYEEQTLKLLSKNPQITLSEIASTTKQAIKTVASLKRKLEAKKVIRGYDIIINHKELGIERGILLLELRALEKSAWIVEFAKVNKNIVQLDKIIGKFSFCLTIEGKDPAQILKEIREETDVQDYNILRITSVERDQYLPLI